MKKTALAALALVSTIASAQTYQPGYFRSDGTYVQGHYRSAPDSNRYNNLNSEHSIYGGTNPFTGKKGTQNDEYSSPPTYNKSNPYYSPWTQPGKKSCAWPYC